MTATATIFHHPDAVESADKPLAGRRTAGQSFLAGYARHVQADTLHCAAFNQSHIDHFRELLTAYGWTGGIEGCLAGSPRDLGTPGTFFVPGPNLASYAWARRRVGQRHYSICGITHTVSTRRIMEGLAEVMTAPLETWDAIICTSRAVQSVVAEEMDAVEAYLARRFAARRVPRPALPVIPLGIDTTRFARSDDTRARLRAEYGLAEDDIAVMSMGRLTIHEKLHPAPLFLALQQAARQTGRNVTLLMAGWFGDKANETLHTTMAREMCPDVTVLFPDGKDEDLRYDLWSAADIFTLPVDNIQETFGLAPVEAMAAGLPVVCSDWNGFKDTVTDGETGYRVRTLMARTGQGERLAHRFADGVDSYHQYLGSVHQRTAIDVREMAAAFAALIGDADKRAAMGAAGRDRAARVYDWSVIIPQYQALWAEMAARRARDTVTSAREPGEPADPSAMDPFRLYGQYSTDVLQRDAVLGAERAIAQDELEHLFQLSGASHLRRMVARPEELVAIQNEIHAHGPTDYGAIISRASGDMTTLEACLLWLLKFDLIQVEV